ncbi:hypothetical protein ACJX0J_015470, partial [Zea mays]
MALEMTDDMLSLGLDPNERGMMEDLLSSSLVPNEGIALYDQIKQLFTRSSLWNEMLYKGLKPDIEFTVIWLKMSESLRIGQEENFMAIEQTIYVHAVVVDIYVYPEVYNIWLLGIDWQPSIAYVLIMERIEVKHLQSHTWTYANFIQTIAFLFRMLGLGSNSTCGLMVQGSIFFFSPTSSILHHVISLIFIPS